MRFISPFYEPKKWFAWYPVLLVDNKTTVWFEFVEYKMNRDYPTSYFAIEKEK